MRFIFVGAINLLIRNMSRHLMIFSYGSDYLADVIDTDNHYLSVCGVESSPKPRAKAHDPKSNAEYANFKV